MDGRDLNEKRCILTENEVKRKNKVYRLGGYTIPTAIISAFCGIGTGGGLIWVASEGYRKLGRVEGAGNRQVHEHKGGQNGTRLGHDGRERGIRLKILAKGSYKNDINKKRSGVGVEII